MANSHTFFATDDDLSEIIDWLLDAGAAPVYDKLDLTDLRATGHEIVLYFPAIGQVEYFANPVNLNEYPENSSHWLQALLNWIKQKENPVRRMVDPGKTPAAGLRLPIMRDDRYWVSGEIWFPTINLRQTFPELGRICGRFERWIRKFPCVFDNRKSNYDGPFRNQIAQADIVQCINALPSAFKLLEDGHHMVDHMVSSKSYEYWKNQWES